MVEIESKLTRKTYVKVILMLGLRSNTVYFIAAITLFFLLFGIKYKSLMIYGISILVFSILYFAVWMLYQCFLPRNSKYFFAKRRFTFGDENILVQFPTIEQVIKWEAFKEWERVAGCYLLILFSGKMLIIPRSDVPFDKIQNFEKMLRQKISKILTTGRIEEK